MITWFGVALFSFIAIFQFISYRVRFKKNNQVRVAPIFVNILLSILILIDFLLIYCAVIPPADIIAHLIIIGGIIGVPFLLAYIGFTNLHIEIQKTGFLYRNFLGIKKFYAYKELYYKINKRGTVSVYKNDKKIVCFHDFWELDYDIILRLIKKQSVMQEISYSH